MPAPATLGVVPAGEGVTVAIPAPGADAIEFVLFDASGSQRRHLLRHRLGDIFFDAVPGVGVGARYGLRARGDAARRFDAAKLLLDPWARALAAPPGLHPSQFAPGADSAAHTVKCVVEAPWPAIAPIARPGPHVIYELHVRGFTMRHPDVPPALRGTFAGLAHPAPIAHLQRLGVTLVELMPCAAWIDERHLPPLGLANYWGYNPVAFLAPDPRLAPGGMEEVRAAVAALHAAGIGVILDVVLNHTGEGDHLGPTVSLRGLGSDAWYRMQPDQARPHVDDTGCGNTLALDRPWPLRLAMDALRHWAEAAGVDGFRLDLASTLGRRADGFDAHAPLLAAMRQDPALRARIIIAEPWDIGPGGYRLGAFPAGWGEWNDRFRDDVRRFWRGDAGLLGPLATRLAGSADIFAPPRPVADGINFVAAHDGFTLADLVAFTERRNHANGEANRDGTSQNHSWNCGVEGPTDDSTIRARRAGDARALLATLFAARGTPMLGMGDEAGRTQAGNNNAYCQDQPLAWFDWAAADASLVAFTTRLIAARRSHPALTAAHALTGAAADETGLPDVAWLHADGRAIAPHEWQAARAVVAVLFDAPSGDRVAVAVNGGDAACALVLPPPRWGHAWRLLADSAAPDAEGAPPPAIAPRAVALLAEHAATPPRRDAPDMAQLARVAHAAGIDIGWFDIAGRHHAVPVETVRALLAALGLPHATAAQAHDTLGALRAEPAPVFEPARCFLPDALAGGQRRFGIAAQTYALRRAGDQGIGDYTALAQLAARAGAAGAMLLGISPPHALMPADRTRASPYQPSDRRFLEPVLLDVSPWAPGLRLPDGNLVDYPSVWAAKRAVLLAAWRASDRAQHAGFGGATLRAFAEHHAAADGTDPDFHVFLQWLCDAQLGAAGRAGAGLYRDLAVGAAPDGAEVATQPSLFLRGFSIGAPPDPLGPQGQVWGLPPPNPRADSFLDAFEVLVAANMRHAAALRIDHVMGLSRLFVVPDGAPGSAGAYLRYPLHAMLSRLAAASRAARCLVIGEDLGTVPHGLADILQAADVLSYRVLWFMPPNEPWPARAAACVSTHDLPPLAGWWTGADLDERATLGLLGADARAARAAERAALGLGEGAFTPAIAAAIHARVAATPSALMLVQADDLEAATIGTNLPGTDRERPNWRRRHAVPVEQLLETETARAILAAVATARR
jgi:glycogen operon protein